MAGNGPERPETAQNDEYPCGALVGVALIWFAAGMLVAGAMLAIAIT